MKKQGSKYQIFVLALVLALIVCALPMSAAENLIGDMNGDGAVNSDERSICCVTLSTPKNILSHPTEWIAR